MSRCSSVVRPLARQLHRPQASLFRPFTSSTSRAADIIQETTTTTTTTEQTTQAPPPAPKETATPAEPTPLDLNPDTVLPEFEEALMRAGQMPIGSRRRRVAMRATPTSLPFEHLPYQAFQEARKILAADREDKLRRIGEELEKIREIEARDASRFKGGQGQKNLKLAGLRNHVAKLKILADVNDPVVKKRYEDGLGDMNKPIYRYYAEKRWRGYDQRLITQRISQFKIVPDILPKFDPTADVQLYFRQMKVAPGTIVDSLVSEQLPRLRVQVFDKGERLVSVVVMDPDVPDIENDSFTKRCHFLAANIPLSPTDTSLPLSRLRDETTQLAVPWLPPTSQKGAPYHRLAIFLLEQTTGQTVDVAKLRELYSSRDGFSLKSFRDKFALRPFGFNMFRSVWDENTADVMRRHNLPGAEVELRPTRVYSMKTPVKPRGWEAKRQGPKYRHLWKYTKRIKGVSNARGWTKKR